MKVGILESLCLSVHLSVSPSFASKMASSDREPECHAKQQQQQNPNNKQKTNKHHQTTTKGAICKGIITFVNFRNVI